MGVNNKQRRAAKRRKRAHAGSRPGPTQSDWFDRGLGVDRETVALTRLLQALAEVETDPQRAAEHAHRLTARPLSVPPAVVAAVARSLLADVVETVVQLGWTPADLGQLVRRRLTPAHQPCLAAALAVEESRHRSGLVSPAWRDERTALGRPDAGEPATAPGLTVVLGLIALLCTLPPVTTVLPPPGSRAVGGQPAGGQRTGGPGTGARRLGRVRALLAKAESSDFDEEAEALTAKAQELISRYALDELLAQQCDAGAVSDDAEVVARRVWLDAPYLTAKGLLVQSVAEANRCRAVIAERMGFSTVIGTASDVEWVELLVTSLLVQADRAMIRHGRHVDRVGRSRTRSFRQSFLVAYASRIGERLRTATDQVAEQSTAGKELVPVLRERSRRVDETHAALFPHTVDREARVSNAQGWLAGRAAADLALLDADLQPITEAS